MRTCVGDPINAPRRTFFVAGQRESGATLPAWSPQSDKDHGDEPDAGQRRRGGLGCIAREVSPENEDLNLRAVQQRDRIRARAREMRQKVIRCGDRCRGAVVAKQKQPPRRSVGDPQKGLPKWELERRGAGRRIGRGREPFGEPLAEQGKRRAARVRRRVIGVRIPEAEIMRQLETEESDR
jgi:hypothetical protein